MDPSRRTILRSGALGVGFVVAGCLDASPTGSSPGEDGKDDPNDGDGANGTDSTNGTDDSKNNDGTGSSPKITDVETIDLDPRTDELLWASDGIGTVALITDADVLERLDAVATNRSAETVDPFLEETDFETEVLVLVESGGPTVCHDSIEVSDVTFDAQESAITATATVVDSSEGSCGEALAYPSSLTRVSFEDRMWLHNAVVTLTDGWGNTETVEAAHERVIDPSELEGGVEPDGDPTAIPEALECSDDEFQRLAAAQSVRWGDADAFAMRVDPLEVTRGESVSITMRNLTSVEQGTGNDRKFSLEVRTEAGWQEVRGHRSEHGIGYTDEGIIHRPGEGFDWEIELTEAAVQELYSGLEVCPGIPAGRYRFVYWPLDLAVAFDVLE
ncbi:hypothetical protein [Natronosalvus rutilus]|uniref:Uncharacterized protein n=1 Tax=Natronosalvus rutilus TaxID=2953753 RepID=A0A9E7N725_9EURY|nr:hypothetical protein [Natronosalvus rutilus]UTF52907.1 hypothetical protein NGM29_14135 [Natronosalvus rutilus]